MFPFTKTSVGVLSNPQDKNSLSFCPSPRTFKYILDSKLAYDEKKKIRYKNGIKHL